MGKHCEKIFDYHSIKAGEPQRCISLKEVKDKPFLVKNAEENISFIRLSAKEITLASRRDMRDHNHIWAPLKGPTLPKYFGEILCKKKHISLDIDSSQKFTQLRASAGD